MNLTKTTTPHQIDLWKSVSHEDQRLEFKEAKNSFDKDKLNAYCVAIANEGGGYLILGISDKHPRIIVGTKAFLGIASAAHELFMKIGFRVDIEEVLHPEGRVLVFHIPSRQKGTAYHLEGRYLMRSGESLVAMSEDKLRSIFAEGAPSWLEEISQGGVTSEKVIELLDTQSFFTLLKLPYPKTQEAVLEKLISEDIITRSEDDYNITRFGALLFAKNLSDFKDISRKAPRIIVYTGDSKTHTKLEEISLAGYACGFESLIKSTMAQLPQSEVIMSGLRKELILIPEIIIRELVANALIHQDFNITGASVMIEIYSHRVEISNPGESIIPTDRFIDGYESRNEKIASLLRRMAICEEIGSGIDKIIRSVESHQLPPPDFRMMLRRTLVVVFGDKPFESMDRSERVRACYQHCCLSWLSAKAMTNQTLRDRFGVSETKSASISHIITTTLEQGLIKADEAAGSARKFARYIPFWA